MKRLFCIIILVFAKVVFLGGMSNNVQPKYFSSSSLIKAPNFVQSKIGQDTTPSDQSPSSQRKKRIKGISHDFLPLISEDKPKVFTSCEKQLLAYYPSISFCHFFSNGKRGPPSTSFSL